MRLLVLDRLALPSQCVRQFDAGPLQHVPHLLQREPQEFQRDDLLEILSRYPASVRVGVNRPSRS
jgi:hypothetical protein